MLFVYPVLLGFFCLFDIVKAYLKIQKQISYLLERSSLEYVMNRPLPMWLCLICMFSFGAIFWYGVYVLVKTLL